MRFQIPSLLANYLAANLCFLLLAATLTAQQAKPPAPQPAPIATFTDIAEKAGLTAQNVFGGLATKKYILETT
jgi:hypothetical protein